MQRFSSRYGGARSIPMNDFHRLPGDHPQIETSLEPDEWITAIHLPPLAFARNSRLPEGRDRASTRCSRVWQRRLKPRAVRSKTSARVAASLTNHGGLIRPRKHGRRERQGWRRSVAQLKKSMPMPAARPHDFQIELAKRTIVSVFSELAEAGVCDERRADYHGTIAKVLPIRKWTADAHTATSQALQRVDGHAKVLGEARSRPNSNSIGWPMQRSVHSTSQRKIRKIVSQQ